jgi:tetratricopeptide (TPR) repeat protein
MTRLYYERFPSGSDRITFFQFRCLIFCVPLLLIFSVFAESAKSDDVLVLKGGSDQSVGENKPLTLPSEESHAVITNRYVNIYDKWREFEAAFEGGKTNQAEMLLMQIVDMREQNSIPKITELGVSAIQLGNRKLAETRPQEALSLFRAASALDPSLSAAYYGQAKAHLSRGASGLGGAFSAGLQGFIAPLSTLNGRIYFYYKSLLILTVTLLLTAAVFAVFLLVRYQRLLLHNAIESYGWRIHPVQLQLILWVLLFVPVFLLLGPLWLVPFWLMVFWGYARPVEKVFAFIFFLVFILAYPAARNAFHIISANADASIAPYTNAFSEGPSPRAMRDLQTYITQQPRDLDAPILLAYLYKKDQAYDTSTDILQKHVLLHPSDARAYNNLAAIYYRQGATDLALRLAQKATLLDGTNALYKYNLSNINRAKFNFSEAENLLRQARNNDPSLINELEENSQEIMVDAVPQPDLVWSRLQKANPPPLEQLKNPFSIVAGALFLLAIAINIPRSRRQQLARRCIKCGTPFCKKCHPILKGYGFCTQCLHIFVKKDGVSPASQKEKMFQIDKYSSRKRILSQLASLVLPGFGTLIQNKIVSGVLLVFFWLLFVVLLAFTWAFARQSYLEGPDSFRILALLCLVVMGAVYLTANLSVHQRATT